MENPFENPFEKIENQITFGSEIWTEKYRPIEMDDVILPKRLKNIFEHYKTVHDCGYFMHGTSGVGKTTIAKILIKNQPHKEINCSLKTGIDLLRTDIEPFCISNSVLDYGKFKYVFFEEWDGCSDEFKDATKALIEKYSSNVRFIATTNNKHKFGIEHFSRFLDVDFNLTKSEIKEVRKYYAKRVKEISIKEKIKIKDNQIVNLVDAFSPSFREILNKLHLFGKGGLDLNDNIKKTMSSDLFELIFNKSLKEHQVFSEVMTNFQGSVDRCFLDLQTKMVDELKDRNLLDLIFDFSILSHKYSVESKMSSDRCASLWTCICEMKKKYTEYVN